MKIFIWPFLEWPYPKHIEKVQKSGIATFFVHPIQRFLKLAYKRLKKGNFLKNVSYFPQIGFWWFLGLLWSFLVCQTQLCGSQGSWPTFWCSQPIHKVFGGKQKKLRGYGWKMQTHWKMAKKLTFWALKFQRMGQEPSNLRHCVRHPQKPHLRPQEHDNLIRNKKTMTFWKIRTQPRTKNG